MSKNIIISIVTYNTGKKELNKILYKILKYNKYVDVYIVDNSNIKSKIKPEYFKKINYIKNKKNIGYGAAHNIVIKKCLKDKVEHIFIINSDIDFNNNIFKKIVDFNKDKKFAMIGPKILNYKDLKYQYLPKIQPSPIDIIYKKAFQITRFLFKKQSFRYEGKSINQNENYIVTNLSGCFIYLNLKILKKNSLFDERFFIYFEDFDLSRRVSKSHDILLYQKVYIRHKYRSGANKNLFLFFRFLTSYIQFFNKWGWTQKKSFKKENIYKKFMNKNY